MNYQPVIGLEVHVQLNTNTKIFCSCSTRFGAEPNLHTCPVCLALPGALPVLNRQVADYAIMAGLSTNCRIARHSVFARKNYFYPDLPKGYQISQFEQPICEKGWLDIEGEWGVKRIGITRIHMEEDAGKLVHGMGGGSGVDLNRAGTPLLEVVSEPDLRSADEAVAYLKQLYQIVTYLGICDGNMEEGSFRCDANVSVMPVGSSTFGTRAEIKNVNSFKFVKQAIEYEIGRQIDLIEDGGKVVQETRLFDPNKGTTRSMRGKEEAHDYRYFPDPDLVPLVISADWVERIEKDLPELPDKKRQRFITFYTLPEYDADVLTASRPLAAYFEETAAFAHNPKAAANWVMGEVTRALNDSGLDIDHCPVTPKALGELIRLIDGGTISGTIAKKVFEQLWTQGGDPAEIVKAQGLAQVSDTGAIEAVIDRILAAAPDQVAEYRGGKEKVFGFFVGQVMKEMKGKANPAVVNELLKGKLA
ncbi:Asp-tRNA(Asn)/Glu-tRNA(Gln) amidotransferase subunit GatB [Trichlorobacter ammonificans]|uniref:Aspartyl/glutamyl-tRNA(Asn/Gln) amidotransferase subunit B n=1 Tax=Trichlorobacter ammonificans TaxID=2916410 RepID=A0ABM9DAI6_9BACT|nr:Asp-tRNA(Asn)/Glu-tRNA(Gln) amidotransferase subunit GatB [Trichlorobacter ammonificans]CAH2032178.1 Aspartyl/glutamyl-tRNA(Asn/Gln) amidotransferase subunit B [Trichlorobacter ammonificans]